MVDFTSRGYMTRLNSLSVTYIIYNNNNIIYLFGIAPHP